MRRALLVISAIGAGAVMSCLLLLSAKAILERPSVHQEQFLQTSFREETASAYMDKITFPHTVKGTNLVVEQVAAYEGPFLEDSSNREVVNVLSIVLRNAGAQGIVKATVILEQAQRRLYFDVETIPPGHSVLVIERNCSEYIQKIYNACYGEQELSQTIWWAKNAPKVEPVDMGTLAVTNTSGSVLNNIWLYYKTYENTPGIYIGGITYKVGIRRLEPGQTLKISPPFYANGYSRIARITTG